MGSPSVLQSEFKLKSKSYAKVSCNLSCAWAEKTGKQLIDFGSPLMGGQRLSPDGTASNSTKEVTGYSFLEAANMDEAKSLLKGHPHLAWNGGCDIELHEGIPM